MSSPLAPLSTLVRSWILASTTAAGSGHPSSSLSATDLMVNLLFGGLFRFDIHHVEHPNNDRLIFSKGHAAPLFYALWAAAGAIPVEELQTLRQFGSRLEGHPTLAFPFTEVPTGSLGQGLSIGVGMAMNAKYLDELPYRTFVLMGDSEMAEGSLWEAIDFAAYNKLDNLIGIIDVNRLGQRGETKYGYDVTAYKRRLKAFGWQTIVVDGHNHKQITAAYKKAIATTGKPTMIIAKTVKGKGISFMENQDGWHGKTLSTEELDAAIKELGTIDNTIQEEIKPPAEHEPIPYRPTETTPDPLPTGKPVATRKAYGRGLVSLHAQFPQMVVLDAETSNSTFADMFKNAYPKRFFEMFIAEQNMVGVALGLARRGKIPFVSTFAAFFSRAFDQIRMSQYANANIKFVGSHAGVSIGEDGPSQMGLEDIAMFRTLMNSVVLYPSDATATEKLVAAAATHHGLVYLRTTRAETPVIYTANDSFTIGGSILVKQSLEDAVTIVAAGITLHEALKAYDILKKENISVRVIDLYSVKPLDEATLKKAAADTTAIITVEDHYAAGGIGEAVAAALATEKTPVHALAVRQMPKSGKPEELLDYEEISAVAIVKKVKELL